MRLGVWLETWFERGRIEWARSTQQHRAAILDKWIAPYLSGVRLRDLGEARVRRWRHDIHGDGCSPQQCNQALRVLSAALGRRRRRTATSPRTRACGSSACTVPKPRAAGADPRPDRAPAGRDAEPARPGPARAAGLRRPAPRGGARAAVDRRRPRCSSSIAPSPTARRRARRRTSAAQSRSSGRSRPTSRRYGPEAGERAWSPRPGPAATSTWATGATAIWIPACATRRRRGDALRLPPLVRVAAHPRGALAAGRCGGPGPRLRRDDLEALRPCLRGGSAGVIDAGGGRHPRRPLANRGPGPVARKLHGGGFEALGPLASEAGKAAYCREKAKHARQDSNLRPLAPEASALSTELRALGRLA